jgi:hypothetical protein
MPSAAEFLDAPPSADSFLAAEPTQPDWKPLYAGLDQAPADPAHREALNFLGNKLGTDKETRAQAINQSYVQSQMPNWQHNVLQQNWPTVRDTFAKEKGFTQGEPITDSGLYSKIGQHLQDEEQANQMRPEVMAFSHDPQQQLALRTANLEHLTFWQEANTGLLKLPEAPANTPDIPAYGLNNPAVIAGVYNSVIKPFVEGATSPVGIATLGLGAEAAGGVKVAQKALAGVTGLFSGLMAYSAAEATPEAKRVLSDPNATTQQKVEAGGRVVGDVVMSLLAAVHTASVVAGKGVVPKAIEGKTPEEGAAALRQEANAATDPKAAEALQGAADKLEEIPSPRNHLMGEGAPEKGLEPSAPAPEAKPAPTGKETAPAEAPAVSPAAVDKVVGIKNAAVDAQLKEMGLPPATHGEKMTFEEARKDAAAKMAVDPEAGAKLVDELEANPRPVTGNEDALLLHEQTRLSIERDRAQAELEQAVKADDPVAKAEAEAKIGQLREQYQRTAEVATKVGTANAQGLALRAMMMKEDYSLANLERQRVEATGKPLTPEQAEETKALHQKIEETQKAFDDYKARMSELLMSDEEPARPARGKPPGKIAAALSEQAAAARERIKSRLTSGRVSAGLDPADIADHAIIGADYLAKGVTKFADWSAVMLKEFGERIKPHLQAIFDRAQEQRKEAARLQAYKTRTANSIEEYQRRVKEGDFSPKVKREALRMDEEGLRLQAEANKAKEDYQKALYKDKLEHQGIGKDTVDTVVKWRRGFLLSSPVTLAKLTSAAALRMMSNPIEEVVGAGLGKIPGISTIAKNAPREGGLNLSAEAESISQFWKQGMVDAGKMLSTGKGTLENAFGHKPGEIHIADVAPRSVIDFFGNMHGALKAPVKRAEFARSFAKRLQWADDHGVDIKDPLVQTRIGMEAYKDANRAIFLQDNMVVDAYKRALSRFEQVNKETGKPSAAGMVMSGIARVLLPIVKVPTNIVAETISYSMGVPIATAKSIHAALTKGLDRLTPEQNDMIMRQFKKGLVGNALLLYGYFNADQFGGYHQKGDKNHPGDVPTGGARVGDVDIPRYLLHNPAMEQLQLGATVAHVAESKLKKSDQEQQGVASGALAAGLGLVEEVPFAREAVEMEKLFDPKQRKYAAGELLKSFFVPALVDWTARQMDKDEQGNKVSRKPVSLLDHIKSGIPGVRENLPVRGQIQTTSPN